jgi:predicted transcriptional regulator
MSNNSLDNDTAVQITAEIVSNFVSNNPIAADNLPELIRSVHRSIVSLSAAPAEKSEERPKPVVPINKSYTDEYIICLEDGKKLKMLRRYLRSHFDMSPEEYRKRWNLPADYPMVAPAYTRKRSEFAKSIGLGKSSRRR